MHQNICLLGIAVSTALCSASFGVRGRSLARRFADHDEFDYLDARALDNYLTEHEYASMLQRRGLPVDASAQKVSDKPGVPSVNGNKEKPAHPKPGAVPPPQNGDQPHHQQCVITGVFLPGFNVAYFTDAQKQQLEIMYERHKGNYTMGRHSGWFGFDKTPESTGPYELYEKVEEFCETSQG